MNFYKQKTKYVMLAQMRGYFNSELTGMGVYFKLEQPVQSRSCIVSEGVHL